MEIPSSVKIGGVTYKVVIADHWFESDGSDGEVFYDQRNGNVIYIRSDLSQEAKEVTFLHEALHCMNSCIDHNFLDSFSEQLYQFLKDNKLIN